MLPESWTCVVCGEKHVAKHNHHSCPEGQLLPTRVFKSFQDWARNSWEKTANVEVVLENLLAVFSYDEDSECCRVEIDWSRPVAQFQLPAFLSTFSFRLIPREASEGFDQLPESLQGIITHALLQPPPTELVQSAWPPLKRITLKDCLIPFFYLKTPVVGVLLSFLRIFYTSLLFLLHYHPHTLSGTSHNLLGLS